MAIYHCSLKVFTRSKGHSAVAAAAYRSGSVLVDERAGRMHRYDKRKGVAETFIVLPANTPRDYTSRAVLWNAAEASENRKNSCVARELVLALPHELSDKERAELTRDMALYLMERYRVPVDAAIHIPVKGDDIRNHHAHLLFSTRELTEDGFGKKTRILDDRVTGKEETEVIRAVWETLANDALSRAGFEDIQIDRRTLEKQGVDRIPQTHIGPGGTHAEHEEHSSQDDEEDEKSEETGSKGGGSGDSLPPTLDAEPSELKNKARLDDVRKNTDQGTRASFVEEIKKLNEERAAYSDTPLKDQIKNIDKLIAKLDNRVEKLSKLYDQSSPSERLKRLLAVAALRATTTFITRQQHKVKQSLTRQEKQARKDRQLKRYGRTYRTGLHEQIKEMRSNLRTLEQKHQEYKRYERFVQKLEKEISLQQPSITTPKKEQSARHTSNTESSLKLNLKAEMIRTNVPEQFKIKADQRLSRGIETKFKPDAPKVEIPRQYQPIPEKLANKQPSKIFKEASEPTEQPNPEYKQPMPVKIKALEDAIAKRQSSSLLKAPESKPSARENWFTPANEKTKPLTDLIDRQVRQSRPQQPTIQNDRQTLKGQFNTKTTEVSPTKRITNEAIQAKTQQEATKKRAQVPPPYEEKSKQTPEHSSMAENIKEKAQNMGEGLRQKWNDLKTEFTAQKPEPQQQPRPRIADGFNASAGNNGAQQKGFENHSILKELNPENS